MGNLFSGFGKAYTAIGAVITTIIALILIYFSFRVRDESKTFVHTNGLIQSVSKCDESKEPQLCTLTVTYTDSFGTECSSQLEKFVESSDDMPKVGETITVYYDPKKKCYATLIKPTEKKANIILGVGILLIAWAWFWTYMVFKYKGLAQVVGAYDVGKVAGQVL